MRLSLWKSTMQKSSSIGVILNGAINSLLTDNEFINFLFVFQNFAILCLKLLKSYDNFSISRVHNICIILYVYDMRDSSAVVGGGDLQTNPEHNEHPGEAGLQLANNNVARWKQEQNRKIKFLITQDK